MEEYRCMICQKPLTDDDKSDQICLRCCKKYDIEWGDSITDIKKNLLKNIADECQENARQYVNDVTDISHSLFSYLIDRSLIKDCPFCGEPGILLHNTINNSINLIGCETNGCFCCINNNSGIVFKTRGEALDAWNKRS